MVLLCDVVPSLGSTDLAHRVQPFFCCRGQGLGSQEHSSPVSNGLDVGLLAQDQDLIR